MMKETTGAWILSLLVNSPVMVVQNLNPNLNQIPSLSVDLMMMELLVVMKMRKNLKMRLLMVVFANMISMGIITARDLNLMMRMNASLIRMVTLSVKVNILMMLLEIIPIRLKEQVTGSSVGSTEAFVTAT